MTSSPYQVSQSWTRHQADRLCELQGTNHAEQIEVVCGDCGKRFDVGVERSRSPVFRPWCNDCWTTWRAGHDKAVTDAP